MAQKFIISNGKFIYGNVDSHWQLEARNQPNKTVGGGHWYYDPERNDLYLYGSSTDFGHVTQEQIDAAEFPASLKYANKIFNPLAIRLDEALASKLVKK